MQTFISVDIQPEYESYFGYPASEYFEWLNENFSKFNRVIFLYNGYDTLGMVKLPDYRYWMLENGLSEDLIEDIKFYDKGYAWFRSCMDYGIDDDDVIDLVKFMMKNDITDSRFMDKEMWKRYAREQSHPWLRDELIGLLEHSNEMIYIPEMMDFLRPYSDLLLTGGGLEECLREVEIALKAMGKNYSILRDFTY